MRSDPSTPTMTFLFTDIEGSTRRWEHQPEMAQRVADHFAVLRDVVSYYGGEIFATMGDGIAAAFGSAEAALQAAVASMTRLRSLDLAVRMGLNTGEAERVEGDYRGRPVNRAARIMAAGGGGQILVADITATLLRQGRYAADLTDLGTHELRDLAVPERLWQAPYPGMPHDFPAIRGVARYAANLPRQRSSMVGRDADLARVLGLLRANRLVTLTGVGGVGKTRLAVQAAADLLPDYGRVCFVELASVTHEDDVAAAVAFALGVGAVHDPIGAAASILASEPTLLVLDNCEHVIDSTAVLAERLLGSCLRLSVLATSREALDIDGEQVVAVRSLGPETAVDLLMQRAVAAGADQEALPPATVAAICARLDGIPLAIELAAARVAVLGAPTVLEALDDRFSVLAGGRRRTLDRHGTMRATIDWSYRLLTTDEQRLFQWLSVFSNGFTIEAARHVGSTLGFDVAEVTDLLASLVHKSMVAVDLGDDEARYRMLGTMRAFGMERLDEGGSLVVAARAHADWVATLTDLPRHDPFSAQVFRNTRALESDAEAWRDAMVLADRLRSVDLATRLCGPPTGFFLLARHDLADLVEPLIDLVPSDHPSRRWVLIAYLAAAGGSLDLDSIAQLADEISAADARDPTGAGPMAQWLASGWSGRMELGIDICERASRDLSLAAATRDLFVGVALLGRTSLIGATGHPNRLVERAADVMDRSDAALSRVTCRLGVAWAIVDEDPERAVALARLAMTEIASVPAMTRATLPGNASRLLSQVSPAIAARALLAQMVEGGMRRSFVDLIPIAYATMLLERVGHPTAGPVAEVLRLSCSGAYLSMMDIVNLSRRVAAAGDPFALRELDAMVRSALTEIAGSRLRSALTCPLTELTALEARQAVRNAGRERTRKPTRR